jgi:hypothetical protein
MEEKNIEEAHILKQNYYNMAKEITEFFDNRSPEGSWKLGKVSPIILGIIDRYAYN